LCPLTKDIFYQRALKILGSLVILTVFAIFAFLFKESIYALKTHGTVFFTSATWHPTENKFFILPIVLGSFFIAFGALLLSLPLSLFAALFTCFFCPKKIKWWAQRIIELYAGIPSVIFGFWGLMKLVPWLYEFSAPGQSLLAGILILCLMIFPILTLSLMASFEMSSREVYLCAESLGLSKSTYIWKILIPSVKKQSLAAILLALGRALGETMAVLMVCGNIPSIPKSIFAPVRTLTSNIALEMSYAMDSHRSALFLSGFILLLTVSFIFLASKQSSIILRKKGAL